MAKGDGQVDTQVVIMVSGLTGFERSCDLASPPVDTLNRAMVAYQQATQPAGAHQQRVQRNICAPTYDTRCMQQHHVT
jgi:hypothetical protein